MSFEGHGKECETTWRKPWKWGHIAQLSWMNCQMLTWIYSVTLAVPHSKVLFSDECAIYHSARNKCVVFWSKENPHFSQELVHAAPVMTLKYMLGLYFFDGSMNITSFSAVLEMWLSFGLEIGAQMVRHIHTSLFLCMMVWTNINKAAVLAMVHWNTGTINMATL